MLNQCNFIGNLGKPVELRSMQNGGQVANLSIAVSESYKKGDEWIENTTWVNIVLFNEYLIKKAENLNKGDRIFVQAKFQTRTWDKDGVKQYVSEFVCQKFDGVLFNVNPQKQEPNNDGYRGSSNANPPPPADDLDDEVMF